LWYSRKNRLSFNALMGSLAQAKMEEKVNLFLATNPIELENYVRTLPDPLLLLFSSATPEREEKQRVLSAIKTLRPNLLLCGGGPHLSACPEDFADLTSLTVKGEGEAAILHIVQAFIEGELSSFPPLLTPSPVDLDAFLPFPHSLGIFGPIEITRGCPFQCAFCQTATLFGTTVRHRSIENILEAVRIMKTKNLLDLRFITPNALGYGSPDGRTPQLAVLTTLLAELRRLMGKKGRIFLGSFPSEIRPEFVSWEALQLLREYVDNDNLVIGAQSGSDRLLTRMHRQHQKADILKATELSLRAGFKAKVDFIFGCPGETEEDVEETIITILTLAEMGALIHAHTFMPLPGTRWARETGTPLSPRLKKVIGRLAQEGKLFGQWYTQERYTRKQSLPQ